MLSSRGGGGEEMGFLGVEGGAWSSRGGGGEGASQVEMSSCGAQGDEVEVGVYEVGGGSAPWG